MDYTSFIGELKDMLDGNKNLGKYKILRKGTSAQGDKGLEGAIRDSNRNYFQSDEDVLQGDFLLPYREGGLVCRFYIVNLYQCYEEGGWDEVTRQINGNILTAASLGPNFTLDFADYEAVKNSLIIRPLNYSDNRYKLKDRVFGDMALALYVSQGWTANGLSTSKVPCSILEGWGKDEDEVFGLTLSNTMADAPARIYKKAEETIHPPFELGAFMEAGTDMSLGKLDAPIVSTSRLVNGAISMFYPGVKEKIAEMFGDSFYAAFTSISEARVHAVSVASPRAIKQQLATVNVTFSPEEVLSRKVYCYHKDSGEFKMMEL